MVRHTLHYYIKHHQTLIMVGTAALLLLLLGASLFFYVRESQVASELLIIKELKSLQEIFQKIDKECTIIGFEHDRNYIDFLNVRTFEGSEVGSMNLAYPQHWQGPYVHDNPTIQEKQFEIIKTKKGYFIVPGVGVRLHNGTVIGRDIVFDAESDIAHMALEENLQFEGKPLVAPLRAPENIENPLYIDDDNEVLVAMN